MTYLAHPIGGVLRRTGYRVQRQVQLGIDKPGPDNTGVLPASALTTVTSFTAASNTVYSDLDILARVELRGLSKVIFNNCRFQGPMTTPTSSDALVRAWSAHGRGHEFNDCTFRPQLPHVYRSGIMGYGFTLRRCDLSYVPDCSEVFNTADPSGPCDVTFEQCWLHDQGWWPQSAAPTLAIDGIHSDGVQWEGGSGLIFRGNTVTGKIAPVFAPNYYGTDHTNSALMLKPDVGIISAGVIDRNWIGGGQFSINIAHDPPDRYVADIGSITNNRFSHDQRVLYSGGDATGVIIMPAAVTGIFTGNVYDDSGAGVIVRHNG